MTSFDVPNLYKCCLTDEVMQDPVVVLTTGQVCDRTSISHESTQTIIPLPGLKIAIHQYQQIYQNNQPEDIFESTPVEETASSSITSDWKVTPQMYQQNLQDVKKQSQLVSDTYQELQNERETLKSASLNLKSQSNEFDMMADDLDKLDMNSNTKSIMTSRITLLKSWNVIGGVFEEGYQKLMNFYKARQLFEEQLTCLKFKEKELVNLRENLSKLLESLEIKHLFTTEFEDSSKNYREPQEINTNQLKQSIKNGFVGNVCVNIETYQSYVDINIQGEVTLHNITFTNAKKGAQYIRFNIPDDNTKITISNCKFEGIGVIVNCPGNPKLGDVVVRNTKFNNMPGHAISIQSCNKCIIEHVKVQGCGGRGVWLHVTEGTLEDVHVSDCLAQGILIYHDTKSIISINNSSSCNCKEYGLYIRNNNATVQGTNVTFENNTKGNVYGNFRQN